MPAPVPTRVGSFFDYEFHQTAIFAADQDAAVQLYRDLGYENWIEDNAELKGILDGKPVVTKARMQFNYDVFGGELEFLTYEGPNRHAEQGRTGLPPFISHMSTYVDDVRWHTVQMYREFGMLPYHRFITQNHTNPAVVGKKRFIEAIYDTRALLGFDLKMIQKVAWDFNDNAWLHFDIEDAAGDHAV